MLSPIAPYTVVPKNNHSGLVYDHDAFTAFIQRQASSRNTKKLACMLEISEAAIGKMRHGDSALSGPTITKWCQRDPDFRSDYFKHVGGHVEASPALVKGLNAAISAVLAGDVIGETHQ